MVSRLFRLLWPFCVVNPGQSAWLNIVSSAEPLFPSLYSQMRPSRFSTWRCAGVLGFLENKARLDVQVLALTSQPRSSSLILRANGKGWFEGGQELHEVDRLQPDIIVSQNTRLRIGARNPRAGTFAQHIQLRANREE